VIIFIDESGDAGFKLDKGSTATFVIAMVIFDDELDAEETALNIKKYRRKINKKDNYEFKFNKSNREYRIDFLNEVKNCKFRIRAIVFRKEKMYSNHLRTSKDSFYNYAVKMVLKNNNETIKNAKIRIDGLGERKFRKSLTVYLRKELNNDEKIVLKNLRFRDSNKDVLIQLADMIAGSIKRSYDEGKNDKDDYKKIINQKIEDIWEFK
jgi:hypothetical protein